MACTRIACMACIALEMKNKQNYYFLNSLLADDFLPNHLPLYAQWHATHFLRIDLMLRECLPIVSDLKRRYADRTILPDDFMPNAPFFQSYFCSNSIGSRSNNFLLNVFRRNDLHLNKTHRQFLWLSSVHNRFRPILARVEKGNSLCSTGREMPARKWRTEVVYATLLLLLELWRILASTSSSLCLYCLGGVFVRGSFSEDSGQTLGTRGAQRVLLGNGWRRRRPL